MLGVLHKLKTFGPSLMQTVYHLVKNIISRGLELPKTLFEKMLEEINNLLNNSDETVSVSIIYFASKTSARIGVFLGKPIDKIESQLKGLAVPYEVILNYLHYIYYKKARLPRMASI